MNAYSIAFDSTAAKIYCGYKKCLKIFDITRPGKNFKDIKLNGNGNATLENDKTEQFKEYFFYNLKTNSTNYLA